MWIGDSGALATMVPLLWWQTAGLRRAKARSAIDPSDLGVHIRERLRSRSDLRRVVLRLVCLKPRIAIAFFDAEHNDYVTDGAGEGRAQTFTRQTQGT